MNVSFKIIRQGRLAVKVMHAISWIGIRDLGYSGAYVARYLGVTKSCVTRLILAGGKQDIVEDVDLML